MTNNILPPAITCPKCDTGFIPVDGSRCRECGFDCGAVKAVEGIVSLEEFFGPAISVYTRAQAIQDGTLIDLTRVAPNVCRRFWEFHTACTFTVWEYIENAVKFNERSDLQGVIGYVLLSAFETQKGLHDKCSEFEFVVVLATAPGVLEPMRFKLHCGPGDDGEPVLTLMLTNED